jgi:cytochrome c5
MKTPIKLALILGSTLVLTFTLAHAAVDPAKLPPAAKKTGVTFDKDIKPLFEASCTKCHGAEKQKGKLRLDTLAAVMRGGESGKVIEAGHSAKSVLVHAVSGLDADTAMPPEGKAKPLTAEQVGLVRAWIDQGAK